MKGKILVVDTAAFVKNVPIWNYAEEFFTCKEVIREIRDKQAKAFYKSLPVEVKIKEPSTETLHFINEFSKKTGDYASLSFADSKIIALAYELDVQEHGGSGHLRKEPEQAACKSVTNITTKVKNFSVPKNILGFYYPRRKKQKNLLGSECSETNTTADTFTEKPLEPKPELLNEINLHLSDHSYLEGYTASLRDFDMASQLEAYFNSLTSDPTNSKAEDFKSSYPSLNRWLLHMITLMEEPEDFQEEIMDCTDLNIIPEVDEELAAECVTADEVAKANEESTSISQPMEVTADDGWQTVSRKARKYAPSQYAPSTIVEDLGQEEDRDYDSEDEGWITPSNINLLKRTPRQQLEESSNALVACISSDFAVQNVLKHIGLEAIGVDGMFIKQLKSYLLRCYACFKLSSNMERLFCYHCGNKTLKRVSVHVKDDGSQEIWINATRPINTKGINKTIPTPRGGKYSKNPILVADQRFPQQRLSKVSNRKINPLDSDYMAGGSFFSTRDIYSRAAALGRIEGNNPNRQSKRKKKY